MKIMCQDGVIRADSAVFVVTKALKIYLPDQVCVRAVTKNSAGVVHVSDPFRISDVWILYLYDSKRNADVSIDAIETEINEGEI